MCKALCNPLGAWASFILAGGNFYTCNKQLSLLSEASLSGEDNRPQETPRLSGPSPQSPQQEPLPGPFPAVALGTVARGRPPHGPRHADGEGACCLLLGRNSEPALSTEHRALAVSGAALLLPGWHSHNSQTAQTQPLPQQGGPGFATNSLSFQLQSYGLCPTPRKPRTHSVWKFFFFFNMRET